ncbi:sigma-54-dependent Fis family transcriptional regulator [Desulfosediminicola ganghwensis]|uniref:sigma-54-dependent Fis family transcriptional regulator n=1 Tax=Desulfosediminicola ganghwensis TaxID=2569540 RepID=UPI0010AD949C|nr:sigma-54-dependent Fis family transcriptional regulator [Desulfosediminicola ganghwensis]
MEQPIVNGTILTREQLRGVIEESHKRSESYGVNRDERDLNQHRLSEDELEAKKLANADILSQVKATIKEFYELMSPEDFSVGFADKDGYILLYDGGEAARQNSRNRKFSPGYRWTERDVGTSATSLCLKLQVPIQLNDTDHYCRRAHGFISSAAPIFGHKKTLLGVLCVFGDSSLVHPHTLIMITSAARSIERNMRLLRRNKDMSMYIGFLDSVIEASGTGMITLDKNLRIRKINRQGKKIFRSVNLEGKPISALADFDLDLQSIYKHPAHWKHKECIIKSGRKDLHIIYSAQPVVSAEKKLLGAVIDFAEFSNIQKLVDKISGTKPFFTFDSIIGSSPPFLAAIELARRASNSRSTILLLGETGTGKELFAQAIHNGSEPNGRPFVPINCGAIPGELLESELFGYMEGSFTGAMKGGRPGKFALAKGGTILLDEIGDMPHDMQVKLLRVLQTGEIQPIGANHVIKVDARIIASTHVNLSEAVQTNRFRQDLYYRLNILQIKIPPLRERGARDIHTLANHFLQKAGHKQQLTGDALKALATYHWPGNIRELENTIQRALHVCDARRITAEDLALGINHGNRNVPGGTLAEMERNMISASLKSTDANMAESARRLGISRATLYRKVKLYQIETV